MADATMFKGDEDAGPCKIRVVVVVDRTPVKADAVLDERRRTRRRSPDDERRNNRPVNCFVMVEISRVGRAGMSSLYEVCRGRGRRRNKLGSQQATTKRFERLDG
jgi:hypothetical protein